MTPERFRRLTEAYGATPEHWPLAERADAQALLAQADPDVLAALGRGPFARSRALCAHVSPRPKLIWSAGLWRARRRYR